MTFVRPLGAVLTAALFAAPALAEFQLREVRADAKGKVLAERTLVVSGNRFRIDEGDAGFIADVGAGKVVWLDHKAKLWRETPLAPRNARDRAAMDPQSAAWQSRWRTLSSDLQGDARLRVVITNETKKIAGVAATRSDVFLGNRKVRERWNAESLPTDEVSAITFKLVELNPSLLQERYFQEVQATAHLGYPVLIRDLVQDAVVEVKEIRKGPIPAAVFAAPPGYRRSE